MFGRDQSNERRVEQGHTESGGPVRVDLGMEIERWCSMGYVDKGSGTGSCTNLMQ